MSFFLPKEKKNAKYPLHAEKLWKLYDNNVVKHHGHKIFKSCAAADAASYTLGPVTVVWYLFFGFPFIPSPTGHGMRPVFLFIAPSPSIWRLQKKKRIKSNRIEDTGKPHDTSVLVSYIFVNPYSNIVNELTKKIWEKNRDSKRETLENSFFSLSSLGLLCYTFRRWVPTGSPKEEPGPVSTIVLEKECMPWPQNLAHKKSNSF